MIGASLHNVTLSSIISPCGDGDRVEVFPCRPRLVAGIPCGRTYLCRVVVADHALPWLRPLALVRGLLAAAITVSKVASQFSANSPALSTQKRCNTITRILSMQERCANKPFTSKRSRSSGVPKPHEALQDRRRLLSTSPPSSLAATH